MRLSKSKKSTEVIEHWPFWMLFSIVISVIGIILFKLSGVSVEDASKIPEGLEDEIILASRFYNSADCFVYIDDVNVPHPGVIDRTKFTQSNLNNCFPQSNDVKYAFSLLLFKYLPPGVAGPPEPIPVGTTFKTPNWVSGGSPEKTIYEDVLIYDNNMITKGSLMIEVENV